MSPFLNGYELCLFAAGEETTRSQKRRAVDVSASLQFPASLDRYGITQYNIVIENIIYVKQNNNHYKIGGKHKNEMHCFKWVLPSSRAFGKKFFKRSWVWFLVAAFSTVTEIRSPCYHAWSRQRWLIWPLSQSSNKSKLLHCRQDSVSGIGICELRYKRAFRLSHHDPNISSVNKPLFQLSRKLWKKFTTTLGTNQINSAGVKIALPKYCHCFTIGDLWVT